jgi:hypothetical protein
MSVHTLSALGKTGKGPSDGAYVAAGAAEIHR